MFRPRRWNRRFWRWTSRRDGGRLFGVRDRTRQLIFTRLRGESCPSRPDSLLRLGEADLFALASSPAILLRRVIRSRKCSIFVLRRRPSAAAARGAAGLFEAARGRLADHTKRPATADYAVCRQTPVECGESPLVRGGKRQQINVRHIARCPDFRSFEIAAIQQAN